MRRHARFAADAAEPTLDSAGNLEIKSDLSLLRARLLSRKPRDLLPAIRLGQLADVFHRQIDSQLAIDDLHQLARFVQCKSRAQGFLAANDFVDRVAQGIDIELPAER